jgi:hypothetical protein
MRNLSKKILTHFEKNCIRFLILMVVLSIAKEFINKKLNFSEWSFLGIIAFITCIIVIKLMNQIPNEFRKTVERLFKSGILKLDSTNNFGDFDRLLKKKETIWSRWSGITFAIIILAVFPFFGGDAGRMIMDTSSYKWGMIFDICNNIWRIMIIICTGASSFLLGAYGGKILLYIFTFKFKDIGVDFEIHPGHLDGVAGLRPLGEFYFKKVFPLFFFLIVYFGIWLLIMHIPFIELKYQQWENGFLVLFILSILEEMLFIFVPLYLIHKIMDIKKHELKNNLDTLTYNIFEIKGKLSEELPEQKRKELNEQLQFKIDQYHEIENMPTWPFNLKIIRKFTFANALAVLPVIPQIIEYISKLK